MNRMVDGHIGLLLAAAVQMLELAREPEPENVIRLLRRVKVCRVLEITRKRKTVRLTHALSGNLGIN